MAGLAAKELKALIEVGTSLGYVGDELKLTAAFISMIRVVDFFQTAAVRQVFDGDCDCSGATAVI